MTVGARRSLVLLVAMVLATRLGLLASLGGASWFWPPAAVAVLALLLAPRLEPRDVLHTGGLLLLGRALAMAPEVLAGDQPWWLAPATGVPGVAAYATGVLAVRAVGRARGPGSLARVSTFLSLLVVVAPIVAALGATALVVAFDDGAFALVRALRFAIGDGLAVVAIVPVVEAHHGARRRDRPPVRGERLGAAALAGMVALAVTAAMADVLAGTQAAVVVVGSLLVAAGLFGRRCTAVIVLVGGVALGVLAAGRPDVDALLDLKALFLATAVVAHLLAAVLARTGDASGATRLERLVDAPAVGPRHVPSADAMHERVATIVRRARMGILLLMAVQAASAVGGRRLGVAAWLVVAVPVAGLVLANAYSVAASRRGDHSLVRRRLESLLDLTVVSSGYVIFGQFVGDRRMPVLLLLAAIVVAMRLPIREALGASLAAHVLLGVVGPLGGSASVAGQPAPVGSGLGVTVAQVANTSIVLVLVVLLVGWAMAVLDGYRRQATRVVSEVAEAQVELAAQQAVLAADRDVLAEQAEQLRSAVDGRDEALVELARARDAMEDFATVAAHDLKAPLASAMMMASAIADASFTNHQREMFAGRITANLRRSADLVDRLLEHAMTQTTPLEREMLDMGVLLAGVVADQQAPIEATGSQVVLPDFVPHVHGDRVLLHQAVSNLVANALRYATVDDRPATIEVTAHHHADGLVLTVRDDGPGFGAEQVDADGQVVARHVSGSRVGLGLGLQTVRRIATRHGGRVWAHDRTDGERGAAVSLLLPLAAEPRATVLLVSPDSETRSRLAAPLVDDGGAARILRADEVDLARALLNDRAPALAVVDLARLGRAADDLVSALRRRGVVLHVLARRDQAAVVSAHGASRWRPDAAAQAGLAIAAWLRQHELEQADAPGEVTERAAAVAEAMPERPGEVRALTDRRRSDDVAPDTVPDDAARRVA